jgi:pimeloyl-ACP methyl ester carboxylesterase
VPKIAVGSRKIYYEIHGDLPGTPLILLTGAGGSCRGWLPLQVPDFEQQFRTLIYDHRGVGESDSSDESFSTADLADDAVGLMDALEIPKANLLGVSMGGMVAQEVALRHPDRVDRLILAGTFARPDAKRRMLLTQWRELSRAGAPAEVMIRDRLLWALQDETLEQTDLIESMIARYIEDGAPLTEEVYALQCDACLNHDTADRLREIKHPTLVICGRHDQLTPPKLHRELADEIPGAHLVTIAYGGHLVMVESAQRFNFTVLQFLNASKRES